MGTRAKKPAGFSIWEGWGDALDLEPKSYPGQAARYMYEEVIDGVRLMVKFKWLAQEPNKVENILKRAERARRYGCKVHLVIDWFEEATGPGTYHKRMWKPPTTKMQGLVMEAIRIFDPEIIEVCNEPYYVKGGKYSAADYVPDVTNFVIAAERANYRGKILASGSRESVGWKIVDGWEWHAKRWERGMLEGKHSLVLHQLTDPNDVYDELTQYFHQGKAIGYQWPVYESEFSGVGTETHINSSLGAELTMAGYFAAKHKKFPICYLTMGGYNKDFGKSRDDGGWGMHTDLINDSGLISEAGLSMASEEGAPPFVLIKNGNGEPPPPPPPNGGPGWHTISGVKGDLKFTTTMAQAALGAINSGGNHFPVSQVACMPQELAYVKAELERILT